MTPDTLLPGWFGNESDHYTDIGPFRVNVYRPSVSNPFARWDMRTDYYRWHIFVRSPAGTGKPMVEYRDSCATSHDARCDAVDALLSLLAATTSAAQSALATLEKA